MPRSSLRTLVVGVLVLAALAGCSGGSSGDGSGSTSPASTTPHLVVMIEENHAISQVLGRPEAREITALSKQGVSLTAMFATTHPSLPDYLALTSGSTHGATNDCPTCTYTGDNLFTQMEKAGVSWAIYAQGYRGGCDVGPDRGLFVRRHVPALVYRQVIRDPKACGRVVPMDRLWADLRDGTLPTVALVVPDLAHDMHGTGHGDDEKALVRTADALVGQVVRATRTSSAWVTGTRFVLTWDEGGGSRTEKRTTCCAKRSHGGHIPTLVLGPDLVAGTDDADHDQYDLLRSIEDRLGLPALGHAASADSHPIASVTSH